MDKPVIFISYSRKDTEFVRRLARDLEQAGYDAWWDVEELRGGQAWAAEIEKHVRACDGVVVVLSPDSNRSEWVGKETLLAIDLKKTIIPVKCRDSELPLALVDRQFVDFRENYAERLQALLQALPSPSVAPRLEQPRRFPERSYKMLAAVAAIIVLGGLAWVLRAPLSGLVGTAPTATLMPTFTPAPASATPTPLPTQTPVPTATQQPTVTSSPTRTPLPTPTSTPAVTNEPRAVTLLSPISGTRFRSPLITFKWSGGALQPGETFQVEIVPHQAEKKGECVLEEDYGRGGRQYSPALTAHQWTIDIAAVPKDKFKPCAGPVEWLVHIKSASGQVIQSTSRSSFVWDPL